MNKLFTKIAGLTIGLAMAIGVGIGVNNNSKNATSANATSYSSIASYAFSNTQSDTAATDGAVVKGWFSKTSGETNIIKSISSLTKVYPGGKGGNGDTAWSSDNLLKIGAASSAGSLTITFNDGVAVDKVVVTGYQHKANLSVTIGGVTCAKSSFKTVSKDNIETSPSPSVVSFTSVSLNNGSLSISTASVNSSTATAVYITAIEFFQADEVSSYTLTYNGNGNTSGSVPAQPTEYDINEEVTVLDKGTLVKAHHSFICWNTAQDGSGQQKTAGQKVTMSQNITLYAQWSQIEFQVKYDKNGGSGTGTSDSNWYSSGSSATVLANTFTAPTNKIFSSWNTAQDGSGQSYSAGDTIQNISSTVTLYAQWIRDPSLCDWKFLQRITSTSELVVGDDYLICAHLTINANTSVYVLPSSASASVITADLSTSTWFDSDLGSIWTSRSDFSLYGWTLGGSENAYTFTDVNSTVLGGNASSTAFTIDGTNSTWKIATDAGGNGTFKITNVAKDTRGIVFQNDTNNSTFKFGHYSTSNVKTALNNNAYYRYVELYKIVDVSSITELSISCDGLGSNTANWESLLTSYSGLSNIFKAYYRHASYDVSGSGQSTIVTAKEGTNLNIAKFVSKYDYMTHKYDLTDFIVRKGSSYDLFGSSRVMIDKYVNSQAFDVTIIVSVSLVSICALGAFLTIKRKKEN